MPSNFFGHLKRALEVLISVRMSPLCDILEPLGRYDHPWEKNKQIKNKHASVILTSGKKYKIPHFCR